MTLRKLATVLPVVAVLALTGPVAGASAQTGSGTPASPGSSIPCYPFPAWCTPDGQALTPWPFAFQFPTALLAHLGWNFPAATPTPSP
jgi:hypothetical protein